MLFWLELSSYLLASVIALALAMTVMALGPRHTLNRLFALFALAESISGLSGFIVRLTLWSGQGYPDFWNELRTCGFCFMGPLLLLFAVRYVGRRSLWADRAAALGLVCFAGLTVPLFQGQFISNARFDAWHLLTYDISAWGLALVVPPALYYLAALALFWRERRRTGEPYLALGVFILVFGFIAGGVFQPHVPVMAFTSISGVVIISYGILSRQLLNPLRELTTRLERNVADRTAELSARTAALLQSEARAQARAAELATVLEALPVPVFVAHDPEARLVTGNRAARDMLRPKLGADNLSLNGPEATGLSLRMERDGVELAPTERPLEVALRGETLRNVQLDVGNKGLQVHVLGNAEPLRDAAGQIYGAISAYTDITELKHAEEALRASEALLRTYIDQSPVAIFVADIAGRYVEANPAACALSGYTRAELLQLTMLDMVPAEKVGAFWDRLQGSGAFSGEVPLRRKDGSVISIIRNRVRLQGGELLSFCTDITARKEAEAQVQRLNAELEQRVAVRTAELSARTAELLRASEAAQAANRAKSSFLAVMGHELRTPLNSIFLAAEMMREKPLLLEAQKNYADIILASGRRLLQMVEGVLELTAAETQLNPALVELAAVLYDIAVSFGSRAERKGQTLTFQVAPDLPPLPADVHQLDHIIRRLLDNALKFTPEGGRIAVTVWREGPALRLTVADTGPGLRQEDLERIFEPFLQLEASHLAHSEGAGLGLTLARRQAEAHGGRLWAESSGEGQGSTFILELPLAR